MIQKESDAKFTMDNTEMKKSVNISDHIDTMSQINLKEFDKNHKIIFSKKHNVAFLGMENNLSLLNLEFFRQIAQQIEQEQSYQENGEITKLVINLEYNIERLYLTEEEDKLVILVQTLKNDQYDIRILSIQIEQLKETQISIRENLKIQTKNQILDVILINENEIYLVSKRQLIKECQLMGNVKRNSKQKILYFITPEKQLSIFNESNNEIQTLQQIESNDTKIIYVGFIFPFVFTILSNNELNEFNMFSYNLNNQQSMYENEIFEYYDMAEIEDIQDIIIEPYELFLEKSSILLLSLNTMNTFRIFYFTEEQIISYQIEEDQIPCLENQNQYTTWMRGFFYLDSKLLPNQVEQKKSNIFKDNQGNPLTIQSPPFIVMIGHNLHMQFRTFEDYRDINLVENQQNNSKSDYVFPIIQKVFEGSEVIYNEKEQDKNPFLNNANNKKKNENDNGKLFNEKDIIQSQKNLSNFLFQNTDKPFQQEKNTNSFFFSNNSNTKNGGLFSFKIDTKNQQNSEQNLTSNIKEKQENLATGFLFPVTNKKEEQNNDSNTKVENIDQKQLQQIFPISQKDIVKPLENLFGKNDKLEESNQEPQKKENKVIQQISNLNLQTHCDEVSPQPLISYPQKVTLEIVKKYAKKEEIDLQQKLKEIDNISQQEYLKRMDNLLDDFSYQYEKIYKEVVPEESQIDEKQENKFSIKTESQEKLDGIESFLKMVNKQSQWINQEVQSTEITRKPQEKIIQKVIEEEHTLVRHLNHVSSFLNASNKFLQDIEQNKNNINIMPKQIKHQKKFFKNFKPFKVDSNNIRQSSNFQKSTLNVQSNQLMENLSIETNRQNKVQKQIEAKIENRIDDLEREISSLLQKHSIVQKDQGINLDLSKIINHENSFSFNNTENYIVLKDQMYEKNFIKRKNQNEYAKSYFKNPLKINPLKLKNKFQMLELQEQQEVQKIEKLKKTITFGNEKELFKNEKNNDIKESKSASKQKSFEIFDQLKEKKEIEITNKKEENKDNKEFTFFNKPKENEQKIVKQPENDQQKKLLFNTNNTQVFQKQSVGLFSQGTDLPSSMQKQTLQSQDNQNNNEPAKKDNNFSFFNQTKDQSKQGLIFQQPQPTENKEQSKQGLFFQQPQTNENKEQSKQGLFFQQPQSKENKEITTNEGLTDMNKKNDLFEKKNDNIEVKKNEEKSSLSQIMEKNDNKNDDLEKANPSLLSLEPNHFSSPVKNNDKFTIENSQGQEINTNKINTEYTKKEESEIQNEKKEPKQILQTETSIPFNTTPNTKQEDKISQPFQGFKMPAQGFFTQPQNNDNSQLQKQTLQSPINQSLTFGQTSSTTQNFQNKINSNFNANSQGHTFGTSGFSQKQQNQNLLKNISEIGFKTGNQQSVFSGNQQSSFSGNNQNKQSFFNSQNTFMQPQQGMPQGQNNFFNNNVQSNININPINQTQPQTQQQGQFSFSNSNSNMFQFRPNNG